MIKFLLGLFLGMFIGIFLMCLLAVKSEKEGSK